MPNPENIEKYKMKKGETLNPNGRPRGFKGLTKKLREIVNADGTMVIEKVKEIDDGGKETGNVFKRAKIDIPKAEMIILAALKKAAKGDMNAIAWLFDRLEGKAKQSIDLTDKRPVKTEIDVRNMTPEKVKAYMEAVKNGEE